MLTIASDRVTKRIKQEYANLQRDPLDICHTAPISESNLHAWFGVIAAPDQPPTAGGTFNISVHFPPTYPLQPLQVTCTTPVFHPNVSPRGEVGLAELQPNQRCWQECVLNEEAARLCVKDAEGFGERARMHKMEHARPSAAIKQALEGLSKT